MTAALASFLDTLQAAAERAGATEAVYRRETAQRIAALERERTFAFRRLNLMRAVIAAIAGIETEEEATARAAAVLHDTIGWGGTSEARAAVVDQFAAVAKAVFADLDRQTDPSTGDSSTAVAALAAFETWYGATHPGPFWALFDQYVSQTPVVDF